MYLAVLEEFTASFILPVGRKDEKYSRRAFLDRSRHTDREKMGLAGRSKTKAIPPPFHIFKRTFCLT